MLDFEVSETGVEVVCATDFGSNAWAWAELRDHGEVTLSRVFTFEREDLAEEPPPDPEPSRFDRFTYRFRFAERADGYFSIPGRIFGVAHAVLIAEGELFLERKSFVAERNISVIAKIADLVPRDHAIVVGGARADAIPTADYQRLLRRFPNSGELDRYASARVAMIIGDYLRPLKDARDEYERYLNRRRSTLPDRPLAHVDLIRSEIEKYVFIYDTLTGWLRNETHRSENDWQKMIENFLPLIFPKYVAVIPKARVEDVYSRPGRVVTREIDLTMVDAGGSIDVIEVKKPFESGLLAPTPYRDNYVPAKELAGGIMQAEKYLFHLTKWGAEGEKVLSGRYAAKLPPGLQIRITNPKATIILGRDRLPSGASALSAAQEPVKPRRVPGPPLSRSPARNAKLDGLGGSP